MTIKTLDKTALQNLRAPIEAELVALGERLGLKFVLGSGTYGDGAEASFKLVMRVDDPETKAAAAKAEWDRLCRYVGIDFNSPDTTGLRPEDLGTEFSYGHGAKATTYRTTGMNTGKKRSQFPILVEEVGTGKVMLLPEAAVPLIRAATDAKAKAAA